MQTIKLEHDFGSKQTLDVWGGKFLTEDNGDLKVNPNWDESKEGDYKARRFRDEWNSIGLLGQVPITKGEIIASSWTKMYEISETVDMYYIFPCAQVTN